MIDPTPDYNPNQPERRELDLALVSLLESIRWGTTDATVLQQRMARVQAAMDDLGMATETYCNDPLGGVAAALDCIARRVELLRKKPTEGSGEAS
jgi:hypothetical protein